MSHIPPPKIRATRKEGEEAGSTAQQKRLEFSRIPQKTIKEREETPPAADNVPDGVQPDTDHAGYEKSDDSAEPNAAQPDTDHTGDEESDDSAEPNAAQAPVTVWSSSTTTPPGTSRQDTPGTRADESSPLPIEDQLSLEPYEYLTDAVILRYVKYLAANDWATVQFGEKEYEIIPPSVCCNLEDFARGRRFTKEWSFFLYNDRIANHWLLVFSYYSPEKLHRNRLFLDDSLDSREANLRRNSVLNDVSAAIEQANPDAVSAERIVFRVPMQTNGYDCGVFMLMFLKHFPRGYLPVALTYGYNEQTST